MPDVLQERQDCFKVLAKLAIRGVARKYLHDPSQDRKNELDPSFKRSDPLYDKISIVVVQCPIQALYISLSPPDMHVKDFA